MLLFLVNNVHLSTNYIKFNKLQKSLLYDIPIYLYHILRGC